MKIGKHYCERCGMSETEAKEDGIQFYKTQHHGIVCEFCREKLLDYARDNIEL